MYENSNYIRRGGYQNHTDDIIQMIAPFLPLTSSYFSEAIYMAYLQNNCSPIKPSFIMVNTDKQRYLQKANCCCPLIHSMTFCRRGKDILARIGGARQLLSRFSSLRDAKKAFFSILNVFIYLCIHVYIYRLVFDACICVHMCMCTPPNISP